jgi:hypothetical protein
MTACSSSIKDAPTVKILPFDEKEAYDHDRPISSLIRTQLLHLHMAENLVVPEKARTNININDLHTELEASEYIQKVTALLHKYGKKAGGKAKPGRAPARKPGNVSGKKAAGRKAINKSRKTKPAAKKRRPRK